jgi:uncharacterized membrane protein
MNLPLNEEIEGKKNVPINTGQHKMFTIENELNDDIGKSLLRLELSLSISKWTFLIQYSTDWILKDYSWFCWLLIILGLIVCIFSCKRYLKLVRNWHMLSVNQQITLIFNYSSTNVIFINVMNKILKTNNRLIFS